MAGIFVPGTLNARRCAERTLRHPLVPAGTSGLSRVGFFLVRRHLFRRNPFLVQLFFGGEPRGRAPRDSTFVRVAGSCPSPYLPIQHCAVCGRIPNGTGRNPDPAAGRACSAPSRNRRAAGADWDARVCTEGRLCPHGKRPAVRLVERPAGSAAAAGIVPQPSFPRLVDTGTERRRSIAPNSLACARLT